MCSLVPVKRDPNQRPVEISRRGKTVQLVFIERSHPGKLKPVQPGRSAIIRRKQLMIADDKAKPDRSFLLLHQTCLVAGRDDLLKQGAGGELNRGIDPGRTESFYEKGIFPLIKDKGDEFPGVCMNKDLLGYLGGHFCTPRC